MPSTRYPLAGPYPNEIVDRDLIDAHLDLIIGAHDPGDIGLQIEQALHRLRAARFDDERQPLGKNVIGADHDRNGKERRRRVARRAQ